MPITTAEPERRFRSLRAPRRSPYRTPRVTELSEDIFTSLLTQVGPAQPAPARPGEAEQRKAPRLSINARAGLAVCGGVATKSRQVTIRCLSRSGVAVIDDAVMRVGERFLLQVPRSEGRPLWLHCTVANTRLTTDGRFRIGARFTTPAGYSTPVVAGDDEAAGGLGARLRKWFAA